MRLMKVDAPVRAVAEDICKIERQLIVWSDDARASKNQRESDRLYELAEELSAIRWKLQYGDEKRPLFLELLKIEGD